jgi:hypothetical protein
MSLQCYCGRGEDGQCANSVLIIGTTASESCKPASLNRCFKIHFLG